jgi:hypothetical protein
MVIRRLSGTLFSTSSSLPSSCSEILIGVRERGFERGRFKRNGEGLLLRSAIGDVTLSPVVLLKIGEECLMSNSSMDAFAVLAGPVAASLFSGMLSERCIRLIVPRGLEKDEASPPSLFIIMLVLYLIVD